MRRTALLALALALGCSRAHDDERCPDTDLGRPVDATLLAFLSRARAAHHAADRAEEARDLPGAIRYLENVTKGPLPPGAAADAPEVREVLADTLARSADLRDQNGDFEAARADIARGLTLAREPTYFRGHLYEVEGLLWERRAASLQKKGDGAAARAATARALEALETSMKIQGGVIERAIPPKPSRTAP